MKIYQGDQYALPFTVKRDGVTQNNQTVQELEIILCGIRKVYPGEIIWHSASGQFLFPLNQCDSLQLEPIKYDVLGRVLYTDGTVSGWRSVASVKVLEMEGAKRLNEY